MGRSWSRTVDSSPSASTATIDQLSRSAVRTSAKSRNPVKGQNHSRWTTPIRAKMARKA
jgi:hypothetical protein